jgi:hypothetical protein
MTPVDLLLWRSMVVAAQPKDLHAPRPISWQARLARLLRAARRVVERATALAGRGATRHIHR